MKSNTPTLRFPEFSGEWEAVKLDDMLSTIVDNRGKTPPVEEEGIPLIEVNAIGNASINYSSVGKYVEEHVYQSWFRKHLSTNDVLFSTVGKTGLLSIYRNERKAAIAQNIVALRAKNSINPDFLYYLLLQDKNNHKFKKIEMIAVQPSVKVSQMIHLRFAVPHFEEQQKIASFLTTVDERVTAVQKKVELLKKYKKGVMQKIFSQEIRFKDENSNEYPEWEEKRLKDAGKILTGTTPSTAISKYYRGAFPWITPTDINSQRDINTSAKSLTKEGLEKSRFIPKDSLLITCIASIGKNAILRADGSCNQQINAIIPNNEHNVEYLYYLIERHKNMLLRYAGAGGMQILNKEDFSKLKFSIPVLREQQKIAEFLTAIDDKIALEERRLQQAKRFKKSLLQQMFI